MIQKGFLFLSATFLCLLATPVFASSLGPKDDGVPPGFYPVEELRGHLRPYLVEGLTEYMSRVPLRNVGQGFFGVTFSIPWPGFPEGAILKKNRQERYARHEASFLAYLNGVAGAPRLLAYEPSSGALVMERKGFSNMKTLQRKGLSKKLTIWLFMSFIRKVSELHHVGVVHADLKPDNILVSLDAHGYPDTHIIDYGLSSLSGIRGGFVNRHKDWEKAWAKFPRFAAEVSRGEIEDHTADMPGIAFTMRKMMPGMEKDFPRLFQLTERAKAWDRDQRPSLDDFFEVLIKEYVSIETK